MNKLKLDMEMLAVDSFATAALGGDEGTVQAHEAPTYPYETCGCTTGASYRAVFCPPASTRTGCVVAAAK
ncbi:MAG TPA: hypothetical protein VEX86_16740 [Longimicrobium sp.]|nr:hypothetical protein [Longimicrobium sp.]